MKCCLLKKKICEKEVCEGHLTWLVGLLGPVILGAKPAEIISYRSFDCFRCQKLTQVEDAFRNVKRIKYRRIEQENHEIKMFFYDPEVLKKNLENPKIGAFLRRFGYPIGGSVEEHIFYLEKRIQKGICPDEIGVFLGYPLKDVLGYVGWSSLELTKVRCWRVYGDEKESDFLYNQIMATRQQIQNLINEKSAMGILQTI